MEKVTIYDWPDSQICSDCVNGCPFTAETYENAVICEIGCTENSGIECPEFAQKENEEEE